MNDKELNLCEILKDCPKGTELYSPIFGKVEFDYLDYANDLICVLYTNNDYEAKSAYFQMDGTYITSEYGEIMLFPSKDNRDWSTWKNPKSKVERFDPKTFEPFDKVLIRDYNSFPWTIDFFRFYKNDNCGYSFHVLSRTAWKQCIPYNDDTKHLVGTTDDAPEYYRYWDD